MRISLVHPRKPGRTTGNVDADSVHAHVDGLAKELTERGHEVNVHVLRNDPLERMSKAVRSLQQAWSKRQPDLVHTHLWSTGLAALAAMHQSGRIKPTPVVQTFHTLDLPDVTASARSYELRRLEAAVARTVDRIVATSHRELADLVALGARRQRIDVVPHGVDTHRFTPEGPVAKRDRSPRLVAAGPMARETGFGVAVSALAGVPSAKLTIAASKPSGECDDWSLAGDAETERLRRIAREIGASVRLHVVAMPERRRVPLLLRSADIVLCTPEQDTTSTIAIEAMACGRPVIATGVGDLVDVVIDGTTGLIIPPRDPRALAHAVNDLLGDPVRLDGFGLAGADRAEARHSWNRIADEVTRVYERAVAA